MLKGKHHPEKTPIYIEHTNVIHVFSNIIVGMKDFLEDAINFTLEFFTKINRNSHCLISEYFCFFLF